jgi:hydrogenase small subunit
MQFTVSRRSFLGVLAALGLPAAVGGLGCGSGERSSGSGESDIELPLGTKVVWLKGAGCSGCSVSFLNHVADEAPVSAADVLLDIVLVGYHPLVMSAAGHTAVALAEALYAEGRYLLVVEGGVPTAFEGHTCTAWTRADGEPETFLAAVRRFAERASGIVAVGSCAAFGGVSAAGSNPAGVVSVAAATGSKALLNIPGCPAHPAWTVYGIAAFLNWLKGAEAPRVDRSRRPLALYGKNVHEHCPRLREPEVTHFGQDLGCTLNLGCKGPETFSPCPEMKWNGGVNWCVDANGICVGCTESTFPRAPLATLPTSAAESK